MGSGEPTGRGFGARPKGTVKAWPRVWKHLGSVQLALLARPKPQSWDRDERACEGSCTERTAHMWGTHDQRSTDERRSIMSSPLLLGVLFFGGLTIFGLIALIRGLRGIRTLLQFKRRGQLTSGEVIQVGEDELDTSS